jgi:glutathione S-transferase
MSPQSGGSAPQVLLYRCQTRTNFLCPCGTVERRLRKLGIEHRTERVALRKRDRPEVVELTGQNRVPLLIDGEEVVHDSKRILQYLDHAYGGERRPDR